MDFVMLQSEDDGNGRLVELIHNLHCEVYEVVQIKTACKVSPADGQRKESALFI